MISNICDYDFVAIDFETATESRDSACAVGIVAVKDQEIVDQYFSILQPPKNKYKRKNIAVHGITPEMSHSAPSLSEVWPDICRFFSAHVPVVAHNASFDISVLRSSIGEGITVPNFSFFDTMDTFNYFPHNGHGLLDCAQMLGIIVDDDAHHNPLSDASVCAQIVIHSLRNFDCITVWEMLAKYSKYRLSMFYETDHKELRPSDAAASPRRYLSTPKLSELSPASSDMDTAHPLYGKNIVFTGELSISRSDAMQLAVNVGAVVKTSVSRKTDYMVIGTQDPDLVGPSGKSTKEEKAYELNSSGAANITLLSEHDFLQLVLNNQ